MKNSNLKTLSGTPRTTAYKASLAIAEQYFIDVTTGKVYNDWGTEVGSKTYEPRVSVRFDGKKYGVRTAKLVGLFTFGPEALRNGVSVRHKDGNKFNNQASNLVLEYNSHARRTYARLRQRAIKAANTKKVLATAA